jgi:hypothetical protein
MTFKFAVIVLFFYLVCIHLVSVNADKDWSSDQSPTKWHKNAKDSINRILNRGINQNLAKNIIFFLGDG